MTPPKQSYRTIPLTKEQVAIVDPEDFDSLSQWSWRAIWNKNGKRFYAHKSTWDSTEKTCETMMMHRFIMGLKKGDERVVDHINHDGLDNRRSNLRVCDKSQNRQNSGLSAHNTSGFKGVSYSKETGKWMARIYVQGKGIYLGKFKTAEEAGNAYRKAAIEHHAEFACL